MSRSVPEDRDRRCIRLGRARVAAVGTVGALLVAWLAWAGHAASREAGTRPDSSLRIERAGQGSPETVPVRLFETASGSEAYLSASEVARLLGASLHWRPDLRKLVLRTVKHTLKVTVDVRFAVVDESETFQLSAPVRQVAGEVYLPLSLFPTVLSGRFVPQARLGHGRLSLVVDEPDSGPPSLLVEGPITRLSLPSARPLSAAIVSARPSRFTVRVPGAHLTPVAGDTLGPRGLIERVRFLREPGSLWMELRFSPEAVAYRVRSSNDPPGLEIAGTRTPAPEFVELEPELAAGRPHPLRVLVLDPGHGGADSGFVAAPGLREKDLTLALAQEVRAGLARAMPDLKVILTRGRDETLEPPLRAEIANRAHADLYLSLHLDGMPGTRLEGVTACVPPPLGLAVESAVGGEDMGVQGRARSRPVLLVGWQRAAGRHHADARGAAEVILASLAADGRGPARLRIVPTYVTLGADCPAVLLECASLTRAEDRAALATPEGLHDLAGALVRALERYAEGGMEP